MADNFGKRFEGVRRQLEEVGYREVTLATGQTGTTDGFLYMDGVTTEISGIPVPTDSTVFVKLSFATYLDASTDAHEAGIIMFGAYRRAAGNVTMMDIHGTVFEVGDAAQITFSETAGDTALSVTIVPSADTTNQAIELTVDQSGGTDTAYVMARAEIICAKKGYSKPHYIR